MKLAYKPAPVANNSLQCLVGNLVFCKSYLGVQLVHWYTCANVFGETIRLSVQSAIYRSMRWPCLKFHDYRQGGPVSKVSLELKLVVTLVFAFYGRLPSVHCGHAYFIKH